MAHVGYALYLQDPAEKEHQQTAGLDPTETLCCMASIQGVHGKQTSQGRVSNTRDAAVQEARTAESLACNLAQSNAQKGAPEQSSGTHAPCHVAGCIERVATILADEEQLARQGTSSQRACPLTQKASLVEGLAYSTTKSSAQEGPFE